MGFHKLILAVSLCISLDLVFAADRQQQCDATTGTCSGCQSAVCLPAADLRDSLYRMGGTAQAYKPASPSKTTICEANITAAPYRVATWPYRRASYKNKIPNILLTVNLLSCGESKKPTSCCCQAWNGKSTATLEVWQTKPDGTYGSLRPRVEDGVCRAQQTSAKGSFEFESLPPGSYGSLGGLGPQGWDFMPYGAPVLHFLASADGYSPTLVDVPLYFDFKTLESKTFNWNDWRGTSWMRQQSEEAGFEVVSWTADPQRRSIAIVLNLFLQSLPDSSISVEESMCESALYGSPSSFFREPMAICGNSMLDFFEL